MCSISDSTSDEAESCWLVRDGTVLASLVVPSNRRERGRGLLGRDGFEGAMLISPARSVHTVRMRFSIDVALLDADGVIEVEFVDQPGVAVERPIKAGEIRPFNVSKIIAAGTDADEVAVYR